MSDRGDHRIGDTERQQAIDLLRSHTGAGRLTLDEFSELAGQVYAAQSYRQLDDVARNLPPGLIDGPGPAAGLDAPGTGAGAERRAETVPSQSTGAPARRGRHGEGRRRFVAIMGGARARGRWRASSEITAFAFWGGVNVDLRAAEVEGPVVDITAWAIMGAVNVTVTEGTRVELDGMVLMGGSSDFTRPGEPPPGSPLVRVHARGLWGAVSVLSKKTREQRAAIAAETDDHGPAGLGPPHPLELPRQVLDDLATGFTASRHGHGYPEWAHHSHRRPGGSSPRRRRRRYPDVPSDVASDVPSDVPSDGPSPATPGDRAAPTAPRAEAPPAAAPPAEAAPVAAPPAEAAPAAATPARPAPSGTLTMMVTDIARSTVLAERLGDRRWMDVLADHNARVRQAVASHGGTEIKAQGDGFLVVFPSARRAILAAVDVQRAFACYRTERPDTPLRLRIGLHTGEIVDVDGDVFGQNVVVAVRIADEAEPDEIVVSALTRDLTVSGGDLAFGPAVEVELKGLSQPWRVHRVPWSLEPA